ncbi:flagellar hook-length control protein FliK [Solidesulfovibrio magneticus]|uniref:Flagellar hook-length control protein n=1 Tax=Solidesulfovibrio magneticus (strain ATCC 700980 / DSM 13731 / RS-1) TaxID=573370 RepID=C4XMS3_SOLM1|nr:flagellar hook-length control protein FliK [Solidesulfovibrio magneticus]BAH74864.1 putative flagellar hook-length control protein [Solidesulfovibrio magneticus RS-1]
MQILPLIQRRTQSVMADAAATGGSSLGSRQSALFASLLDNARADSTPSAAVADLSGKAAAAEVVSAAASPSEEDIKTLPVTREDIAALRSELKDQGFSDEELDAMEAKAGDGKGMTWGELMDEVEKKVSSAGKGEKKAIGNDDQVQILGLLGKLGFTADQSQQMVEALSRGETQSVMAAIDEKLAGMSSENEVQVGASEMTALGRALNLSEQAQSRLSSLMGESSGQTGQGIVSAMSLVKNELLAQLGQENQKMAEFREAASDVLQNAWQRDTTGRSSDLHQDDVARKAGQIVAMSSEEGEAKADANGLDALADVPQAGKAAEGQESPAAAQTATDAAPAGKAVEPKAGAHAELAAKAGAVATEQAGLAGTAADASAKAQGQPEVAPQAKEQAASTPVQNAEVHQQTGSGQQGAAGGNAFGFGQNGQNGQSGHDESMAELLGKIRFAGRTATSQPAETSPTLAAMDALKSSPSGQQAKTIDPALAARVARQVESGILKGAGQEAKQLTLTLTPDELGKVQVTLTVKDKEVRAVISADNADTTAMLQEHAAKIKQSLEEQGFKVSEVEVRSQLSQDNQTAAWDSPERHNEAREQREALERIRSSVRLARDAAAGQGESLVIPEPMTARASGLDLFA